MAAAPLMELSRPISGLSDVFAGLDQYLQQFEDGVEDAADAIAAALEGYAKTHHLWGNPYSEGYTPTGHTNQSTRATVFMRTREYAMIALSAGMDYDVFLELARKGKWAWLYPAVMDMSDEIGRIVAQKVRAQ